MTIIERDKVKLVVFHANETVKNAAIQLMVSVKVPGPNFERFRYRVIEICRLTVSSPATGYRLLNSSIFI